MVALAAVLAVALGTALRRGAGAVTAVIVVLASDPHLKRHVQQIAPMTAGLAIQATTHLRSLPIGPWAGLAVLGAWATAALIAGGLVLRLRDA